jgi:hypothetical protein
MNTKDCLNCDLTTCIKPLHRAASFEGGEFHVLKELINQNKIFLCKLDVLFYVCCRLIETILRKNDEDPFLCLAIQCLYDLRTSAFLAITAHYRGAIQLIRPAIETFLVGIYFRVRMDLAKPDEIKILSIDIDNWYLLNITLNSPIG